MDWTRAVDGYCERVGPEFWAEPVNAVTNLGFVLVALWLWPRVGGAGRALCAVLMAIGVGSFLFHSFAQAWAGMADVLPILIFVLLYIYLANRDFVGLRRWAALGATALFLPYAAVMVPAFRALGMGASSVYAPVPVLIALYGVALARRAPELGRGLLTGAGLLVVSLACRMLDGPLCEVWPIGTHFLWHLLNAAMLGWMIWVWQRHMLATGRAGR